MTQDCPLPYSSALRVYEPLAAFRGAERSAWETYLGKPRAAHNVALARELRAALASITGTPPRTVPAEEPREAYVLDTESGPHVCPWQIRQRSWVALDEFRTGLPPAIVSAFVPPLVLGAALEDLRRWQLGNPEARTHIRTARWYVPVEWFVAFSAQDRHRESEPRALLYRTAMSSARKRVALALRTLRRGIGADPVTESVEDLGRWLEEFDPRAVLELDYGGLLRVLSDEALDEDTSVADFEEALAAMTSADETRATAAYRRLVDRWRPVQALEHAN